KGGDLSGEEHFLTTLRVVHPILALGLLALAWFVVSRDPGSRKLLGSVPLLVGRPAISRVVSLALGVRLGTPRLHLAQAAPGWVPFVWLSALALTLPARAAAPEPVGD